MYSQAERGLSVGKTRPYPCRKATGAILPLIPFIPEGSRGIGGANPSTLLTRLTQSLPGM